MQKSMRLLTLISLSVLVLVIAGCSLSGPEVSIEERIDDFEDDLSSGNFDNLYTHVHPDNNMRSKLKSGEETWPFVSGESYSFSNVSNSGDNRDVTVETSDANYSPSGETDTWTFKMKEDKPGPLSRSTWYVNGIRSANSTDPLP